MIKVLGTSPLLSLLWGGRIQSLSQGLVYDAVHEFAANMDVGYLHSVVPPGPSALEDRSLPSTSLGTREMVLNSGQAPVLLKRQRRHKKEVGRVWEVGLKGHAGSVP